MALDGGVRRAGLTYQFATSAGAGPTALSGGGWWIGRTYFAQALLATAADPIAETPSVVRPITVE